jgi:hypothetical protein
MRLGDIGQELGMTARAVVLLKLRAALVLEGQERDTGTGRVGTDSPIRGHDDKGKEPATTTGAVAPDHHAFSARMVRSRSAV